MDNRETQHGITVFALITDVFSEDQLQPTELKLLQNYPNPFNPETTIAYQLSAKGDVKLSIYNTAGGLVRNLVDKRQFSGSYSVKWDGKNDQNRQVASGIYVYRIVTTDFVQSRKFVLMR